MRLRSSNTDFAASLKPATILLVDDDLSVLESLGRVLIGQGWTVVMTSTGEEAVAHLGRILPDLVVTDLRMKGLSGWDLLFHESLEHARLPIIVISALPPEQAFGAETLAAEYFQKPLDIDALLESIRRHLGQRPPFPSTATER